MGNEAGNRPDVANLSLKEISLLSSEDIHCILQDMLAYQVNLEKTERGTAQGAGKTGCFADAVFQSL